MFTQDGLVEENYKVNLYTGVVVDNVQQDIARGNGEYLASLGVLMDVPQDRRDEWKRDAQNRYSTFFPDTSQPSEEMLIRLNRDLAPIRK